MKKYPCIESTIEFKYKNYEFRLWINQDVLVDNYYQDHGYSKMIGTYISSIEKLGARDVDNDFQYIVNFCVKNIEGLNAIQMRNIPENKNDPVYGVVVYTVDFSSDVHG